MYRNGSSTGIRVSKELRAYQQCVAAVPGLDRCSAPKLILGAPNAIKKLLEVIGTQFVVLRRYVEFKVENFSGLREFVWYRWCQQRSVMGLKEDERT